MEKYLKLVAKGIYENREFEYLKEYFKRKFKKAQSKGVKKDEFFKRCLEVSQSYMNLLKENEEKAVLELKKKKERLLRDIDWYSKSKKEFGDGYKTMKENQLIEVEKEINTFELSNAPKYEVLVSLEPLKTVFVGVDEIKLINTSLEKLYCEIDENADQNDIEIDFSDTNAIDKIICLKELGVLDFLRDQTRFNASTYAIAKVIGLFTGEKSGTIQSYINPIGNPKVRQDKNPYKDKKESKEKVIEVRDRIINLGVTLPS